MRRKTFETRASELNLPRRHWDTVYRQIRRMDELTRLIWEVDKENKPSLIAVCRIYGTGSQESFLVRHKTRRVRIPLSWRITMSNEEPRQEHGTDTEARIKQLEERLDRLEDRYLGHTHRIHTDTEEPGDLLEDKPCPRKNPTRTS